MRYLDKEMYDILKEQGPMTQKQLIDIMYQRTHMRKVYLNDTLRNLKSANKVGFIRGQKDMITIKEPYRELQNNTDQKFQICGTQVNPNGAITKKLFDRLYRQFSGYFFDFLRINGEHTSAYFMIDQDMYERWEIDGRLPDFEMYIREILNDMELEHENGLYEFDGVVFSFICV